MSIGIIISRSISYLFMVSSVIGCFFSIFSKSNGKGKGLGLEWEKGLQAMTDLIIPIAATLVSIPILKSIFAPFETLLSLIGSNPGILANYILPIDEGGYQLAYALTTNVEDAILASLVGYNIGVSVAFNLPVGLQIVKKQNRPAFAMAMTAGFLFGPFAVFCSSCILVLTRPMVRASGSLDSPLDYELNLKLGRCAIQMVPLFVIGLVLAALLLLFPKTISRIFVVYGKLFMSVCKIILALNIFEYFTNFFKSVVGWWGFDPIMADEEELVRAVEVCAVIGFILTGALPFIYMFRIVFKYPLAVVGKVFGLSSEGTSGLIAQTCNALLMFDILGDVVDKQDLVLNAAFCFSGAFVIGDHAAFALVFQPTMVLDVVFGKIVGGIASLFFCRMFLLNRILKMTSDDGYNPESANVNTGSGDIDNVNPEKIHEIDDEEGISLLSKELVAVGPLQATSSDSSVSEFENSSYSSV